MMNSGKPNKIKVGSSLPAKKPKKVDISKILRDVETTIVELNQMKKFCTDRCQTLLKGISEAYWDCRDRRKEIGDKLAELNYAGQLVKMLRAFNSEGIFKDDSVWFPTYHCLNIIWNYSSDSPKLSEELVANGIIDILGPNLAHKPYLDAQNSQNVVFVLKSSLNILYNVTKSARDLPAFTKASDRAEIKQALRTHHLASENQLLKCAAIMIITYIIGEDENGMLQDTGAVSFILSTLMVATGSGSKRRHRGFSAVELTACLGRMAMNDENKDRIVEEGALAVFVNMMEYSDPEENAVAARTVWLLSFKKDIREKTKAEKGLLEALNKLKDSQDENTRTSAEGALWTINEKTYDVDNNTEGVDDSSVEHVFISYERNDREMVELINDSLKEDGYRTWVDYEQIIGFKLEERIQAIADSAVVLICASDMYKQSPNCRTEIECALSLDKEIVPLLIQHGYTADGWLGGVIGNGYLKFDEQSDFQETFQILEKSLNGRGKEDDSSSSDTDSSDEEFISLIQLLGAHFQGLTRYTEGKLIGFSEGRPESRQPEINEGQSDILKLPEEGLTASPPPEIKEGQKDISEIFKDLENYLEELDQMDDLCNDRCRTIFNSVLELYENYYEQRMPIGEKLAELNYTGQLVKILRRIDREDVFKDDEVWITIYLCLSIIWNYTDASPKLCEEMVINGAVDILGTNITYKPYLDQESNQKVGFILLASLSCLHNISEYTRHLPEFDKVIEETNVKKIVHEHYLKEGDDNRKCVATMLITSIISEDENMMLADTGSIAFIVTTLKSAINSDSITERKRRDDGYTATELVKCLSRMALNDENKAKIVEEGALVIFVNMMEYSDPEENAVAARTVWVLSFKKDIREKIKAEKGLLEALNKLKDSQDKNTRTSAEGALWTINEKKYETKTDTDVASKKHIFISYDWSNQKMAEMINENLKKWGYKTWIDVDNMRGSTLEAMGEAVENAVVVLICASEGYKDSPNCRSEAEYTFQLKKDIVPILMQRYYKVSGWLGMLFGAKFYLNFDGKYEFDKAFQMLLTELRGRGKDDGSTEDVVDAQVTAVRNSTRSRPKKASCSNWSEEKVEEFFDNANLTSIKRHLEGFDGNMLMRLKTIKREAPEFFYHYLETNMKLDIKEMVRFVDALETL